VTEEEQHTLGLQLTVILLLVLMIALKVIPAHPEWFGDAGAAAVSTLDAR
jgi:hypothetical protein